MNGLLTLFYLTLCVGVVIFVPPLVVPFATDYGVVTAIDCAKAVLLCTALAAIAGYFSYKRTTDGTFLLRLFVSALIARMIIALVIFCFHGQDFFGGDAITYDFFGNAQALGWGGDKLALITANQYVRSGEGSGWGMVYLVAAVYSNRLKIGMALQCDPTVIYALERANRYNGNLTRENMQIDSPYNTYRYPGLPPGPIANPGRASLDAAARPADVPYLYFVARGDGSHAFAATLEEHNRNVDQYQRRRH